MRTVLIDAAVGLCLLCSCGSGGHKGAESGPVPSTVQVEDKDGCTVKGLVTLDGAAAPGVVVSDGVNLTRTNRDGKYWLKTGAESDFVFVSIPSGAEVATSAWEPRFWYRFHPSDEVQRFDFALRGRDNSHHKMVVITDVHISGRTPALYSGTNIVDSLQFRRYFLPAVKAFAASCDVPCYALNLGDMMQEIHSAKAALPEYRGVIRDFPMPLFHVIGNHDYMPDLPLADEGDEETRGFKEYYMSHMGPRYYSFNIGEVHYVVLDACKMLGGGSNKYQPHISPAQLAWLRKDLSVVDKTKSLVIATHIAAYRSDATDSNPATSRSLLDNRDALMEICEGFANIYIWSGDAHISEVLRVNSNTVQTVHGALGGSVWWSRICTDGSPAAYTVYDFDGGRLTATRIPYESTVDDQFALRDSNSYTPDGASKALVVNVPAWELSLQGPSTWKIEVLENGVKKGEPVRFRGYDAWFVDFASNYKNPDTANKPRVTNHLFYYIPEDTAARLTVTVTDAVGRQYRKETTLKYDN